MTPVDLGIWGVNGVLLRKPGGGSIGPTEAFPAMFDHGYRYVGLNVEADPDWPNERRIAAENHLPAYPWMQCRTTADLDVLFHAAVTWGSPAMIVNIEIEQTRSTPVMAYALGLMARLGKAILVTDGWADPIGRWHGYRRWVGSVECFPEVNPAFRDVHGCVLHASAFFRGVVPMLGAYGTTWKGRKPILSDYVVPAGVPHIVYCGDDVDDWKYW